MQTVTVACEYFAYDPVCGFETFKTEAEAQKYAQDSIDSYREEAAEGWSEDVCNICWGVVRGTTKQVEIVDDYDGSQGVADAGPLVDYVLTDSAVQTPAVSVQNGWKAVPIEPTPEMVNAGSEGDGQFHDHAKFVYTAMLAAAPQFEPVTHDADNAHNALGLPYPCDHPATRRPSQDFQKELADAMNELAEWRKLRDPHTLHINLCRGIPARLTEMQLQHIAGSTTDAVIDGDSSPSVVAEAHELAEQMFDHCNTSFSFSDAQKLANEHTSVDGAEFHFSPQGLFTFVQRVIEETVNHELMFGAKQALEYIGRIHGRPAPDEHNTGALFVGTLAGSLSCYMSDEGVERNRQISSDICDLYNQGLFINAPVAAAKPAIAVPDSLPTWELLRDHLAIFVDGACCNTNRASMDADDWAQRLDNMADRKNGPVAHIRAMLDAVQKGGQA